MKKISINDSGYFCILMYEIYEIIEYKKLITSNVQSAREANRSVPKS
jgi:hypothetical protein